MINQTVKIIIFSISFSPLFGNQITKDWQLLATLENINLLNLNNHCIEVFWKYKNSRWQVYVTNHKNLYLPEEMDNLISLNKYRFLYN